MTSTTGTLDIEIIKNDHSKINEIDFENLAFGKNFSDHMLMADFENGKWGDFRIIPFGNFEIHPSMASLHYGQALFEGLKAYKSPEGDILLGVIKPITVDGLEKPVNLILSSKL